MFNNKFKRIRLVIGDLAVDVLGIVGCVFMGSLVVIGVAATAFQIIVSLAGY